MGHLNKHLIASCERFRLEAPNSEDFNRAEAAVFRSQELCSHPQGDRREMVARKGAPSYGIEKGDTFRWCQACSAITSHRKIQQPQPCQDG